MEYPIEAGVPQGSVLGPTLYIFYTADIPTTEHTETAMFADDTSVLSVHSFQEEATKNLQHALNKIQKGADKWKITLNEQKSTHHIYKKKK